MSAMDRLSQVFGHLNFPNGMLDGQVALITGAAQGIGAEAARLFVNEGATVVLSDLDADKVQAVAKKISEAGGKALAVPGDLLNDSYIEDLVKKAAQFGNGRLTCIVNCAGFTFDAVIHKTSNKQWDMMLAMHQSVPFKIVRAAAPYFRVKDNVPRNIINISSTSGIHGNAGQANYATAKAGMVGLTKTIAKEWGPQFGVRANTIAYGYVKTRLTGPKEEGAFVLAPDGTKVALGIPMAQQRARGRATGAPEEAPDIPLRRGASPTEAAASILAVASPLFSYVTGQTIMVTGGRNM